MDKSSAANSNINPSPESSVPPERKAVAFSGQSIANANTNVRSPIAEKILSRKPTPFNNDLAAAIRKCGFGAAIPKQHEPNQTVTTEQHNEQNGSINETDSNKPTPAASSQVVAPHQPPPPSH